MKGRGEPKKQAQQKKKGKSIKEKRREKKEKKTAVPLTTQHRGLHLRRS